MSWVLIEEGSRAWSIVHEKNVLRAGSKLTIGQAYKFFYQGNPYKGTVLALDDDRSVIDFELKKLQKASSKSSSKPVGLAGDGSNLPPKRRLTSAEFYGEKSQKTPIKGATRPSSRKPPAPPKMSKEEKERKKLEEASKAKAFQKSQQLLRDKLEEQKDPDFKLDDFEAEGETDESDAELLTDLVSGAKARKSERSDLIKSFQKGNANPREQKDNSSIEKKSPTKEELQRELALTKMKLQLVYEKGDTGEKEVEEELHLDGNSKGGDSRRSEEGKMEADLGVDLDRPEKTPSEKQNTGSNLSERNDREQGNSDFEASIEENPELASILESVSQDYQLYGEQPDSTKLMRGIYCKKSVLTTALNNATSINHLLRRLMTGVFIPSKIVDCTVTGQAWRAGGKDNIQEVKPLHLEALTAICDFANAVAERKKWKPKHKTFDQCKTVFSHKLIEIRNAVKTGSLKD